MSFRYCSKINSITLFVLFVSTLFSFFPDVVKADSSLIKSSLNSNINSENITPSITLDNNSMNYQHIFDSINSFKLKQSELSGKFKDLKFNFQKLNVNYVEINKAIIILLALTSLFILFIIALVNCSVNLKNYEESKINIDMNLQNSNYLSEINKRKQARIQKQFEDQKKITKNINIEMVKGTNEDYEKYEKSQKSTNYITKDINITFNEEFQQLLKANEISKSINDTFDYDDKEDFKDIISYI